MMVGQLGDPVQQVLDARNVALRRLRAGRRGWARRADRAPSPRRRPWSAAAPDRRCRPAAHSGSPPDRGRRSGRTRRPPGCRSPGRHRAGPSPGRRVGPRVRASSTAARGRGPAGPDRSRPRPSPRVVDIAMDAGQVGPAAYRLGVAFSTTFQPSRSATWQASSRLATLNRGTMVIPYALSSSAVSDSVSSRPPGCGRQHLVDHPLDGLLVDVQQRHRARIAVAPVGVRGQGRQGLDRVGVRVEPGQAAGLVGRPATHAGRGSRGRPRRVAWSPRSRHPPGRRSRRWCPGRKR